MRNKSSLADMLLVFSVGPELSKQPGSVLNTLKTWPVWPLLVATLKEAQSCRTQCVFTEPLRFDQVPLTRLLSWSRGPRYLLEGVS